MNQHIQTFCVEVLLGALFWQVLFYFSCCKSAAESRAVIRGFLDRPSRILAYHVLNVEINQVKEKMKSVLKVQS